MDTKPSMLPTPPEAVELQGPSLDEIPLPSTMEGLGTEVSEVEDQRELERKHRGIADAYLARPHRSAMVERFGWLVRWLMGLLFSHVLFERRCVDNIRDAHQRGTVVYVMQTHSRFDYLYFNYALKRAKLPLARFANDVSTGPFRPVLVWLKQLFRRSDKLPQESIMEALVTQGHSALIFLDHRHHSDEENLEFSQKYLYRLVRAQKRQDQPIFLMPLMLFWERRPDPQYVSFLGEVFGTNQRPGFFRKITGFIKTTWQSFFNLGQPMVQVSSGIELQSFLKEYPNAGSADACELIRQRLERHFAQERAVIIGPTPQNTEDTYASIAKRPELLSAIQALSLQEGIPQDTLQRRARRFFDEIAAKQSLVVVKIFSMFLGLVWYRIFDGFEVDEKGLDLVREAGKDSCLILIPSHKSHVDYLVLSYLFYHYGLVPPHIAAGVNLSFFPMGPLFRRSGAFFIRRSFKGEDLYPVVFKEYLVHLMSQGYPIEFFIEGTRSRTGKLVKPRYGMLEMILQAYTTGRVPSVRIVPISVGYEKIIESEAYKKELLGAQKKKESIAGLLKTPKILTSRYGRLNVQFGKPIDLGDYFERYDLPKIDPSAQELTPLMVRLAHRIIYDINHVTAVTPTALVALVLLNSTTRHIERDRLLHDVGFVLRFLLKHIPHVRLSKALEGALTNVRNIPDGELETRLGEATSALIDEALELFLSNDHLEVVDGEDQPFYRILDEARVELSFYRNNIVHLLVPEGLLAMAMLGFGQDSFSYRDAHDETLFLSKLFKYEWIYEERAAFGQVFDRSLERFRQAKWLQRREARIELDPEHHTELNFFRRVALTFLEAYVVLTSFLEQMNERELEREELLEEALKRGRTAYLRGEMLFFESISKPTMLNAIRLLKDWGVLQERREPTRKKDRLLYRVSASWRGARALDLHKRLEQIVYLGQTSKRPKM